MAKPSDEKVDRISLSLPKSLVIRLDNLTRERGFDSRSQAVAEMLHHQINLFDQDMGDQVMAGTITLFYSHAKNNLRKRLAEIEYEHIDEVISSLHVLLEKDHMMEVILVQGPVPKLREIADELITCKGVKTGSLTLISSIIPPIHPLGETAQQEGWEP